MKKMFSIMLGLLLLTVVQLVIPPQRVVGVDSDVGVPVTIMPTDLPFDNVTLTAPVVWSGLNLSSGGEWRAVLSTNIDNFQAWTAPVATLNCTFCYTPMSVAGQQSNSNYYSQNGNNTDRQRRYRLDIGEAFEGQIPTTYLT